MQLKQEPISFVEFLRKSFKCEKIFKILLFCHRKSNNRPTNIRLGLVLPPAFLCLGKVMLFSHPILDDC